MWLKAAELHKKFTSLLISPSHNLYDLAYMYCVVCDLINVESEESKEEWTS